MKTNKKQHTNTYAAIFGECDQNASTIIDNLRSALFKEIEESVESGPKSLDYFKADLYNAISQDTINELLTYSALYTHAVCNNKNPLIPGDIYSSRAIEVVDNIFTVSKCDRALLTKIQNNMKSVLDVMNNFNNHICAYNSKLANNSPYMFKMDIIQTNSTCFNMDENNKVISNNSTKCDPNSENSSLEIESLGVWIDFKAFDSYAIEYFII